MFNCKRFCEYFRVIGILCLSAILEYVCASASARVFKGEVGPFACYGMS